MMPARTHDQIGAPSIDAASKGLVCDERGFTLIEVIVAIVILGIVGASVTYLVIRLTSTREKIVQSEQSSLAARMAAERIWELFAQSPDAAGSEWCPGPIQNSAEPSDDQFRDLYESAGGGNGNQANGMVFRFACQSEPYWTGSEEDDGSKLHRVRVWVKRTSDGVPIAEFFMLAREGGYLGP